MTRKTLYLFLVFLLYVSNLTSQDAAKGGAFSYEGADPKSMAMGGAYVAITDDATSLMCNPAGLGFLKGRNVIGVYSRLFGLPLNTGFFAYGQEDVGYGAMGFSWQYLTATVGFDAQDWMEGVDKTSTNYGEHQINFVWAKPFIPYLSVGGAIKVLLVSSGFENGSATGYGLDLGVSYRPTSALMLGLVIRNPYTPINWGTGRKERIPFESELGVAYSPPLAKKVLIALDIVNGEDLPLERIRFGVEGWIVENIFAMRAGYDHTMGSIGRNVYSVGIGLQVPIQKMTYGLDYAYTTDPEELGNTHRIGVSGKF